ncbi:MAG TPA: DUF1800 domain-containing protein [Candidatus Dormibacteraeota bacterium]|nr:DUF1800 domain-containing protein [Candidatus Dormibacteraeota bacterium]
MSIAGSVDEPSGPAEKKARSPVSRRTVLGAAAAGGAGIAALRVFVYPRVEQLLQSTRAAASGRGDWISPLGSEKARVAHLLRRTTFGATLDELEKAVSDGYSKTVDRLLETRPAPPPSLDASNDFLHDRRLNVGVLQQWWLDHMLSTSTPFAERMTLFWHGHFTSDYRKVGLQTPYIYWQNLTWRDMALTDMRSMLMRVTTDPAMLRYLDLGTSTGQNPNENYSRELLELFALGVGHYGEDDVRAGARALAGWTEPRPTRTVDVTVDAKNNVVRKYAVYDEPATGTFVANRAYKGGQQTFLGRKDTYDTEKVVDRILAQPAAAEFIARKVVQHFVAARVDDSYVKRLGSKFRSSKYDVKTLMREVLVSPEFVADHSYRALVKSPTEFMVQTLKALQAPQLSRLAQLSAPGMGQVLFDPPDVGGWPNNEAWISSNSVVARVNFVTAVLSQLKTVPPGTDAPHHLDGVVGQQTAGLLNTAADDHARWFLALASPEFQLK